MYILMHLGILMRHLHANIKLYLIFCIKLNDFVLTNKIKHFVLSLILAHMKCLLYISNKNYN
jgi:hypothetical protein